MKILKNKQTVILLSITFVLTIITGAALILFLNSPVKTIELPEFTEKTIQEIMSWKDANELSDNQVIYQHEYSEDKEKDTVLAQSVKAGTKLKEEDQVIFTVSKGYDPDKEIDLPEDMDKMTEEQLSTYFETNHFSDVTFEYVV